MQLSTPASTTPAFRLPVQGRVVVTESGADPAGNHHVHPSVPNQAKAYDLLGIDAQGRMVDQGDGSKVEDYVGWGMPIVAAAAGRVVGAVDEQRDLGIGEQPEAGANAFGNRMAIAHDDGSFTLYGHMQQGSVRGDLLGSRVEAGTVLGLMGNSGNSSAPHLHVQRQLGSPDTFGSATAADLAFTGATLIGSYRYEPGVGLVDWRQAAEQPSGPRVAHRGDVLEVS